MIITHLITDMEIGGAQRLLCDLLPLGVKGYAEIGTVEGERDSQSDKQAAQMRLCILQGKGASAFMDQLKDKEGIDIICLNPEGKQDLNTMFKSLMQLRKIVRDSHIVHVHLFPALYYAAIASAGLKCKLIYTEHNTFNRRRLKMYLRPLERWIYSRYSNVICISKAVRNNLAHWIGKDKNSPYFRIINNGIPVNRFIEATTAARRTDAEVQKKRSEIFGRQGVPVLMISRFVDSKDQPTLIRAIKEIEDTSIYAVLVGDGPRRGEYEDLIKELKVEDRVIMLGSRSDISELIAAAEIGVQSSNWEGFGLTVVEMFAGMLPVIISEVDGLNSVADGYTLTFKRGDYKGLARQIERMAGDSALRRSMGTNGVNRARDFDIEIMGEQYHRLYTEGK